MPKKLTKEMILCFHKQIENRKVSKKEHYGVISLQYGIKLTTLYKWIGMSKKELLELKIALCENCGREFVKDRKSTCSTRCQKKIRNFNNLKSFKKRYAKNKEDEYFMIKRRITLRHHRELSNN